MKKDTQHIAILKYFRTHRTITPMQAFRDLGITKLATRVSEMKRDGYIFGQEMINVTNRYGETVRVMEYSFKGRLYQETFYTLEEILEGLAA